MAYIPLFLHPGTPLEKEVDLEHARQWMKAGVIPDNTPCARTRGGVAMPLADVLRAADMGRTVLPLTESGAPSETLHSVAGARLRMEEHPGRSREDPLRPEEREYLIANRLVSPRYVNDVTHTQAAAMIRRHRLRTGLWSACKAAVALSVIGASAYGVKFYLDSRQQPLPVETPVAKAPPSPAAPEVAAKAKPVPSAPTAPAAPRLTRAQEREMRRAAAAVNPSDAWTLQTFGGRVGVLYDKARGGVLSARCGGAFLAERDGNVYLFTALSALASAQNPAVAMLDGRTIEVAALPMSVFGDWDMAAFLLGRSSGGAKADDDDTPDGMPLACAAPGERRVTVYLLDQANSATPALDKRDSYIWRDGGGNYFLRDVPDSAQMGCPVLSPDASVIACVARKSGDISGAKPIVLAMASLPGASSVSWEVFVRERDACRRMVVRTESFQKLAAGDFTLQNLPDRTVSVLLRATSEKASAAAARYTESLRDTSKLQENFRTQLRQIAQADVARFTLPYFIAQADAHVLARQQALQSIDAAFTVDYLAIIK